MFRKLLSLCFTILSFLAACTSGDSGGAQQQTSTATPAAATPPAPPTTPASGRIATRASGDGTRSSIGFRSRAQFNEHFQKHGTEFGRITQQEYLREAQSLRDAPVGGNIEEIRRADGTTSRFDRSTGAFIAFNRDGTIRTFFKPNDGEAYFRRQATRVH